MIKSEHDEQFQIKIQGKPASSHRIVREWLEGDVSDRTMEEILLNLQSTKSMSDEASK